MCRHLLPRLDLPVGRALHGFGQFAVSHPTLLAAAVLLPICAAVLVVICRDLRRPVLGRWLPPGPARRLSIFVDDRFGPVHPG